MLTQLSRPPLDTSTHSRHKPAKLGQCVSMSQHETSEPIIVGQRVIVSGESVRVGAPVHSLGHGAEPKIQLIREEGVIRAIDVTCSCGEKIRIRCEYS